MKTKKKPVNLKADRSMSKHKIFKLLFICLKAQYYYFFYIENIFY